MRHSTCKTLALAGVLALFGSIAAAAEEPPPTAPAKPDELRFFFNVDPLLLDYRLTDDRDENSAKFEEYRDFYDGFGIPKLRLSGASEDHNRTLEIVAKNVALDDASYRIAYDVAGLYSITVENNRTPHRFGNQGTLLYGSQEAGVLRFSDSARTQLQGTVEEQFLTNRSGVNFRFLEGLIQPYIDAAPRIDLALRRDRTQIRADIAKMRTWSFSADVLHENRTGTRPYGAAFGFNSVTELPEPIDYDTVNVTLGGEWNGKKAGLQLGLRHSRFTNHVDTLIYDNPWRSTDSTDASAYQSPGSSSISASSRARNVLAPDNDSNELFAAAQARIGKQSWVSGSMSYVVMSQDDQLVPHTINSAIDETAGAPFDATDAANLSQSHADTQVNVLNFTAAAGTRLGNRLDLKGSVRRYDYDNQSSRFETPGYARYDAVWEEIGRITVPYAYTRTSAGLEAAYKLGRRSSVSAGYTFNRWDRDFREIESSDESVFRLNLSTRAVDKLWLRATFERGDRSIDEYDVEAQEDSFTHPEGANNLPTLRKFDEAGRAYNDYRLQAQYALSEKLSLTFGFGGRTEDYEDENGDPVEFGLRSDKLVRFNAEVAFTPKEGTTLYVFGDHADREIFQRARQSGATLSVNPADDWEATFDEANDTLGAGLNLKWAERWTLDVSTAYARSDGEADLFSPPGGTPNAALGFGNYEDTKLSSLGAKLVYSIVKGADVGLVYRFEDYSIDSFISQGLSEYLPGALILNADNGGYTVSVYAARLGFRF